jgi:hypothetical protein
VNRCNPNYGGALEVFSDRACTNSFTTIQFLEGCNINGGQGVSIVCSAAASPASTFVTTATTTSGTLFRNGGGGDTSSAGSILAVGSMLIVLVVYVALMVF